MKPAGKLSNLNFVWFHTTHMAYPGVDIYTCRSIPRVDQFGCNKTDRKQITKPSVKIDDLCEVLRLPRNMRCVFLRMTLYHCVKCEGMSKHVVQTNEWFGELVQYCRSIEFLSYDHFT